MKITSKISLAFFVLALFITAIAALVFYLVAKDNLQQEAFVLLTTAKLLFVFIACTTACVTWFVSSSISKLIIAPLRGLQKDVKEIAYGDLDYKIQTHAHADDEIGQLAKAFGRMTVELKKSYVSIDELNKEISERKYAQQSLKRGLEKIARINHELKNFAYVISHDLKVPLFGIKALSEWIAADYQDKLDDTGKENLTMLINQAELMNNLIEGVLRYSRIGHENEEKADLDLNELVHDVAETVSIPKSVEIRIKNTLPVVKCEKTRLTQVFQNLLSNAVKYMDRPDGIITVDCIEQPRFWQFSVADNGPGIEEKHHERIFKIFEKLSGKEDLGSTGVGLTIVKKIVELYAGRVWVESRYGKGSTFFFTFSKKLVRRSALPALVS